MSAALQPSAAADRDEPVAPPPLTEDQRAALARAGGAAVEIEDRRTGERYVLLRAEAFASFQEWLRPYSAGWEDPAMALYDDYDAAPKP